MPASRPIVIRALLRGFLLATASGLSAAACPPGGWTRDELVALKARQFAIESPERESLATGLLGCLADPDPVLRDGIAFEGLASWLRAGQLPPETVRDLTTRLLDRIESGTVDADGIGRPFDVLVLSELVRTDRVAPHFPDALRTRVARTAVAWFEGIRDYRGYDDTIGWRHGVAHGADWLMQLALNPAYGREELAAMRRALLSQVRADGAHAYVDGESERLARAVLVLMQRQELDPESWRMALAALADPAPLPAWSDAWTSKRGLVHRHNLRLFLMALHLGLGQGELPHRAAWQAEVLAVLRAMG